jgi:hypothetical protein
MIRRRAVSLVSVSLLLGLAAWAPGAQAQRPGLEPGDQCTGHPYYYWVEGATCIRLRGDEVAGFVWYRGLYGSQATVDLLECGTTCRVVARNRGSLQGTQRQPVVTLFTPRVRALPGRGYQACGWATLTGRACSPLVRR